MEMSGPIRPRSSAVAPRIRSRTAPATWPKYSHQSAVEERKARRRDASAGGRQRVVRQAHEVQRVKQAEQRRARLRFARGAWGGDVACAEPGRRVRVMPWRDASSRPVREQARLWRATASARGRKPARLTSAASSGLRPTSGSPVGRARPAPASATSWRPDVGAAEQLMQPRYRLLADIRGQRC